MSYKIIEPTKAELEILTVLWRLGSGTVRQVNQQLNQDKREVQYSSTLKLMQVMLEKKLLLRDESNMKHVYTPAHEEQQVKAVLLDSFLESAYDGAAGTLLVQLLGHEKVSREQLQEIKDILNKL